MVEPSRDLLLKIAGSEAIQLEPAQEAQLQDLIQEGLVGQLDNPRQMDLEARYNTLQETHQLFLEVKACLDRLQRRLAPKSRLAEFFPTGGAPRPSPEDPDVARIFELLQALGIQVREVDRAEQVPDRIGRIKDRIQVDSRDCLDRLASTDRELDALQKNTPPGTLIDQRGHFALTEAGERTLPEAQAMEELESAFHAVAGPRKHKIAEYSHFREDPANLLAFVMEGQTRGAKASAVVADFEALSDAFERQVPFSEIPSVRTKNAFLIRLIRAYREDPKRPYLWCNRERLLGLMAQMRALIPATVMASGWGFPYAVDLFIVNHGPGDPSEQEPDRRRLFEAIQARLATHLQDVRIGDGQFTRLALALMHGARVRNFSPSILLDRFVKVVLEAASEGSAVAPHDLGDRGAKLIFGFHLAQAAGFSKDRIGAWTGRFAELEGAFAEEGRNRRTPAQVVLHALVSLDRLDRAGHPVTPRAYADTFLRIRRRLIHHTGIARAFGTEHASADDQVFLAANLAAHTCFAGHSGALPGRRVPDVGLAGLYEPQDQASAPLLGQPFGTLMLS